MPELQVLITGDNADAGASELETLLRGLGDDVTVTRRPAEEPSEDVGRRVDPVAVAALILAIPGAALAAWDMVDRIRKRRRAEAVISAAKRLRLERRVETDVVTVRQPVL